MILFVGLGNPGTKYQNNRHNVGHMFIDFLGTQSTPSGIKMFKIQTFMNVSGQAVKKLTTTYHLQPTNLIIAHDDLDVPLGKFKIQKGTGPKLHNGLESIENTLSTKDFWRIRIGVDNRTKDNWINGEAYVLQNFTPEEKELLNQTFPKIKERLQTTLNNVIASPPIRRAWQSCYKRVRT